MGGVKGSRSAASTTKIVAIGIVVVVLVAATAGYFLLLRPRSPSANSPTTQGDVASGVGSSQSNPVSAVALYNDYNLGGQATDYPQFTNHTIYAKGNLTSIVRDPKTSEVETQVNTGANDFEYWDWQSGAGLPAFAENQAVLAHCFVRGLVPSQNGTSYLYLDNCNLISVQGSKAGP